MGVLQWSPLTSVSLSLSVSTMAITATPVVASECPFLYPILTWGFYEHMDTHIYCIFKGYRGRERWGCDRFLVKPNDTHLKSFNGVRLHAPFTVKQRDGVIVKASSDVDGVAPDGGETASEGEEDVVPVENLPLESKLQLKLEQKLRMKIAKKIRLRRKRLVRKRRMRKKGRWPPSKMKKNKNV
ncbi:50S ribosomal protein 5, chloroplastic [Vitis vinifera]|uniref:50S ribosomal protein 5, chloroplastic n=1 Tax=Vitis vinifera TaxID=29760 RepID=A0A438BXS9_VITVI|nr:50S ribosomal protein 5, chloroplastic [Vitis vinifera]